MNITIEVSEKTEGRIRRRAEKMGVPVNKVVSDAVEEFWNDNFSGEIGVETLEKKLTINDLTGLFSSEEKVDTSMKASEIMRSEMGLSRVGLD